MKEKNINCDEVLNKKVGIPYYVHELVINIINCFDHNIDFYKHILQCANGTIAYGYNDNFMVLHFGEEARLKDPSTTVIVELVFTYTLDDFVFITLNDFIALCEWCRTDKGHRKIEKLPFFIEDRYDFDTLLEENFYDDDLNNFASLFRNDVANYQK